MHDPYEQAFVTSSLMPEKGETGIQHISVIRPQSCEMIKWISGFKVLDLILNRISQKWVDIEANRQSDQHRKWTYVHYWEIVPLTLSN